MLDRFDGVLAQRAKRLANSGTLGLFKKFGGPQRDDNLCAGL
jgi:hypothetical protein